MLLKKKLSILFLILHILFLALLALFLGMTFPLLNRMVGEVGAKYWQLQAGILFWCIGGAVAVYTFSFLNKSVPKDLRLIVAAWIQVLGFLICSFAHSFLMFYIGMIMIGLGSGWFFYLTSLMLYWLNMRTLYPFLAYGVLGTAALGPFFAEVFVMQGGWRFLYGALFTLGFILIIPYAYINPTLSGFILNEKPLRNSKSLQALEPLCSSIAMIFAFLLYWFSTASIFLESHLYLSPTISLVSQGGVVLSFLGGTLLRLIFPKIKCSLATLYTEFLFWTALLIFLASCIFLDLGALSFVLFLCGATFFGGVIFANLLGELLFHPHTRFQRKLHLLQKRLYVWGAIAVLVAMVMPRAPAQVCGVLLIIGGIQMFFYYFWIEKVIGNGLEAKKSLF